MWNCLELQRGQVWEGNNNNNKVNKVDNREFAKNNANPGDDK